MIHEVGSTTREFRERRDGERCPLKDLFHLVLNLVLGVGHDYGVGVVG
jgi:hypothetical protein